MLDALEQTLRQLYWPDSHLENVVIDYDSVTLTVRDTNGRKWQVSCDGFIGQEIIGFWDEAIIEEARLSLDGDLMRRALSQLQSRAFDPSGCTARNAKTPFQLDVVLIDGCMVSIVANQLQVEPA